MASLLRSLLTLALFWMSAAAKSLVKFKLKPAITPQECPATAAELAALVGLEQVRTVFRGGAKHQAAHEASGLHLWYQGVASSEEAAKQAVASLAALEDRVAIAEIQHEVKLH